MKILATIALILLINDNKWLFILGKDSSRAIDPSRVVEVTVIDESQEIQLWLRDVCRGGNEEVALSKVERS